MPESAQHTSCSIERVVEWIDTDAAGHQHNSAILRWVESCEAQLMRSVDLPEYFPVAPRVQHTVNYREKLWFGQKVTTTIILARLGRSSMSFNFEVRSHAHLGIDSGLAADGSFITVHVPRGSERSAPWPEVFRRLLVPAQAVPLQLPQLQTH